MARSRSVFSFQAPRFSPGVSVLFWLTAITSVVVGAIRSWGPASLGDWLLRALTFIPGEWHPWTWVTFLFLDLDPLSLIFTCLMIFWFGADLESTWGRRRMLTHYFASILLGAAALSLLGLALPRLAATPFGGGWMTVMPLLMGLALALPDRQMNFFLMPPFNARLLVPIVTGVLVLMAIMTGSVIPLLGPFFMQMAAVALATRKLALRLPQPSKLWLRVRVWWFARQMKGKLHVVPGLPKDDELGKPRSGSRGSDNYLH